MGTQMQARWRTSHASFIRLLTFVLAFVLAMITSEAAQIQAQTRRKKMDNFPSLHLHLRLRLR